jgi:hypothetical protein
MSTFNVHEWNRKRYLSEEKVNEGKVKEFLLKMLLKTTGVVSPDTLKYVYSEVVKQVGEDKANKAFQELGLDPSKYLNENEVKPQTDLIGIAAHTLKDMSAEEAIDAIDRLMLYLKDAKADIEYKDSGFNLNEEYTMANFRTINDFMTSMASPGGIEAFYKLPTQTKAELFRFYAEELEDDRF